MNNECLKTYCLQYKIMNYQQNLWSNVRYLYCLQGINYIGPLITIPYLIRILGLENFGLISFAYAFVNYFVVITNFGFQLSGTKKISLHRHDKKKLSTIFCAIFSLKLCLFIVSFSIFMLIVRTAPIFHENNMVYMLSFLAVFGNVLYPNWFFMGIEAMKPLAIINSISKIICLIGILYFVKSKDDILAAVVMQSSVDIICGIFSLIIIKRVYKIKFHIPSILTLLELFKESWNVFLSQIYVTLLTSSNTFILGLFAAKETIGIFATADKIVRAIAALSTPINNAVFPTAAKFIIESQELAMIFLHKIFVRGVIIFTIISLILFTCSNPITSLITGYFNADINFLVKIMAIIPLVIFIYNFYGNQILINLSFDREFKNAILYAGLFSIFVSLVFVPIFYEKATAIIFLAAELLIMMLMIFSAHKNGYNLMLPTQNKL